MADYLPIFINTDGLNCLVVGGGKIALRKILALLRFQVKITVVSEEINHGLRKLLKRGLITWKKGKFSPCDLSGLQMVIAAANHPETNHIICRWAEGFGILCNVVDDPRSSGFIFSAVHRMESLTIAVSTQGAVPALARKIKREIAGLYGKDYGDYLGKLSRMRQYLKTIEPDIQKRRRILHQLVRAPRQKIQTLDEMKLKEELTNGLLFNRN
ncbi:MAG: bifunctional precorrin-2 dehydrogenase/sirohydrochlorin ferrochelatase [Firmicutes bacterium]|nr:bifunctional precorrin-2 dehydrogenase/sirohydrochlorin ferrochelatase [Bacillota bacterium]